MKRLLGVLMLVCTGCTVDPAAVSASVSAFTNVLDLLKRLGLIVALSCAFILPGCTSMDAMNKASISMTEKIGNAVVEKINSSDLTGWQGMTNATGTNPTLRTKVVVTVGTVVDVDVSMSFENVSLNVMGSMAGGGKKELLPPLLPTSNPAK